MARKSKPVANRDKPLCRVPVVPFYTVPIVYWELMVEVMVTLPERHKCRGYVVSWRVLIIERAFAQPVGQGINRKDTLRNFTSVNVTLDVPLPHMMNRDHPKGAGVEVSTPPVTPKVPGNHCGDDYSPGQSDRKIIPILPLHHSVLAQVAHISWSRPDSRFHEHPHHVALNFMTGRYKRTIPGTLKEGSLLTHQKPRSAL